LEVINERAEPHGTLLCDAGLLYNGGGDLSGAQTERRGGAGPVGGLLGGKDPTGRFSCGIRYGGRTIFANRPTTSWLLLLLTEQLLGFRAEQTQLFEMRRGQAGHPLACYSFPTAGGSGKRHSCTTPAK
jgi:hypothetical protein